MAAMNPWYEARRKPKPKPPPPIDTDQKFPTELKVFINKPANPLYPTRTVEINFMQASTVEYGK